jgi:hypothetical protein
MSCTEARFHSIQTSFAKILDIGLRNPDDSVFAVQTILGNLDSSLVPPSFKERVVEIIETEGGETMEESLNTALRKYFLPTISKDHVAPVITSASPTIAAAAPEKEKLESKSKEGPDQIPAKILALAKLAGISEAMLKERLILVKIEGRLCGIFQDIHVIPEFIKFLQLLENSAEKEELAFLREAAFAASKPYKGVYGLEKENLYFLAGFIKYCFESDPENIKKNQEAFLGWVNYSFIQDQLKAIGPILNSYASRGQALIALTASLQIAAMLKTASDPKNKDLPKEKLRKAVKEFEDLTFWRFFCGLGLQATSISMANDLSAAARKQIIAVIEGREDEGTREGVREVTVDMRDDVMVESTVATLPKVPKELFALFHMGADHVPGFLNKLSKRCKVERVS